MCLAGTFTNFISPSTIDSAIFPAPRNPNLAVDRSNSPRFRFLFRSAFAADEAGVGSQGVHAAPDAAPDPDADPPPEEADPPAELDREREAPDAEPDGAADPDKAADPEADPELPESAPDAPDAEPDGTPEPDWPALPDDPLEPGADIFLDSTATFDCLLVFQSATNCLM